MPDLVKMDKIYTKIQEDEVVAKKVLEEEEEQDRIFKKWNPKARKTKKDEQPKGPEKGAAAPLQEAEQQEDEEEDEEERIPIYRELERFTRIGRQNPEQKSTEGKFVKLKGHDEFEEEVQKLGVEAAKKKLLGIKEGKKEEDEEDVIEEEKGGDLIKAKPYSLYDLIERQPEEKLQEDVTTSRDIESQSVVEEIGGRILEEGEEEEEEEEDMTEVSDEDGSDTGGSDDESDAGAGKGSDGEEPLPAGEGVKLDGIDEEPKKGESKLGEEEKGEEGESEEEKKEKPKWDPWEQLSKQTLPDFLKPDK